jgi:putative heme-binding domain-containing protein
MKRYVADRSAQGDAYCRRLLAAAPASERGALITALDESTRGPRRERADAALVSDLVRQWQSDSSNPALTRICARLGHAPAVAHAQRRASDASVHEAERLAMIEFLGELADPLSLKPLTDLATGGDRDAIQVGALRALAPFDDRAVPSALLAIYSRKSPGWRSQAQDTLLGRASSAAALLEAVDAGRIAASDVPLDQVRRVAVFHDGVLEAIVRKHWGSLASATPEEKLAEVRRLNNDLRAAEGDATRGRALFAQHCANCHRLFGEGKDIGPDLTHANRGDRDYLLVSLVDPNAVVRKEYQSYLVSTRGGRILTGQIVAQSGDSITVRDAEDRRTTLTRDAIETLKESPTSLMPEGLYRQFNPEQIRDLFRYLQASGPLERSAAR